MCLDAPEVVASNSNLFAPTDCQSLTARYQQRAYSQTTIIVKHVILPIAHHQHQTTTPIPLYQSHHLRLHHSPSDIAQLTLPILTRIIGDGDQSSVMASILLSHHLSYSTTCTIYSNLHLSPRIVDRRRVKRQKLKCRHQLTATIAWSY